MNTSLAKQLAKSAAESVTPGENTGYANAATAAGIGAAGWGAKNIGTRFLRSSYSPLNNYKVDFHANTRLAYT